MSFSANLIPILMQLLFRIFIKLIYIIWYETMKHDNMTILNSCHTQNAFIFFSLVNQQIQVVLPNIKKKKFVIGIHFL